MMLWWCLVILVTIFLDMTCAQKGTSDRKEVFAPWQPSWRTFPTSLSSWSLLNRIPMTTALEDYERKGSGNFKVKKKLKKLIMPLLIAYKLKFFTLIPVLVGGLLLLTATTGLAGFFFALFAAAMGLKSGGGYSH